MEDSWWENFWNTKDKIADDINTIFKNNGGHIYSPTHLFQGTFIPRQNVMLQTCTLSQVAALEKKDYYTEFINVKIIWNALLKSLPKEPNAPSSQSPY